MRLSHSSTHLRWYEWPHKSSSIGAVLRGSRQIVQICAEARGRNGGLGVGSGVSALLEVAGLAGGEDGLAGGPLDGACRPRRGVDGGEFSSSAVSSPAGFLK